jgi:hypothetical protein
LLFQMFTFQTLQLKFCLHISTEAYYTYNVPQSDDTWRPCYY